MGQEQVACCCEGDDELSGSLKCREFRDQLKKNCLLRTFEKDCAALS